MWTKLFWFSILSRRSVLKDHEYYCYSKTFALLISECKCNPEGSTSLECERINGDCSCKESVTGLKCDDCMPHHFNFPFCQGMFQQLVLIKLIFSFYFQTANVILMVQELWNVEKTMVFAHAKKALPEWNVMNACQMSLGTSVTPVKEILPIFHFVRKVSHQIYFFIL